MVRDGRGSLTPLLAVVVLTAGGAALLIGRLGGAAVDRARARTAADATALAGAAEGRAAAWAIAADNAATVVEYHAAGLRVSVVVRVGDAVARATAERSPVPAAAGSLARSGDGPLPSGPARPPPAAEGDHPR